MFIAIGYLVTLGSIFGGFAMAGGHLAALFQPLELLMIFGGAAGAFVTGNSQKNIKATLKAFPGLFKGAAYNKEVYVDVLAMLFEVLAKVRKEGLMSIESDVEEPEKSQIFAKYPKVMADHHVVEFLTDYLRMMVGGNLNVFEIEGLMDAELEAHHKEEHAPADALAKLGDGMPAFGTCAGMILLASEVLDGRADQRSFGAIDIVGGRVNSFKEKPKGDGAMINGGFFVLSPEVLRHVAGDATVWEQEPLNRLAEEGQLMAYEHSGFWQPMDTLRDKQLLEEL